MPIYEVVITEALLQRTRAETVDAFLPKFLEKYPGWEELAKAGVQEIEDTLQPIGLHRRRAKTLKALSETVLARGGRVPTAPRELFSLPGVGQYLFYAICLYRENSPLPLLDASMARLLERYFGSRKLADIRYDPYLQQLARRVVEQGNHKHLNWAMLDLAATLCRSRKPACESCCLAKHCLHVNARS